VKGASVISLNFEGPEGSDLQPIDQDLACHWLSQNNAAGDWSNSVVSPSPPIGHLEFVRSEARQRKITHDEDEDYPPHRPNGADEVRAVLGVVHAFWFP
jgi:hypothetical protein